MMPMNLQEEVKKLEEQESAINAACPMEDEASWVITWKGDHEEETTLFDGETPRKMAINEISKFLSNVDNVKISPEGFDSEATWTVSRARMRFRTQQLWKEIGEVTELIPKERIPECIVEQIIDDHIPEIQDHIDEPVGRKLESTTKVGSGLGDEDEKNKLQELKVIIVVEGDAEFIKKS